MQYLIIQTNLEIIDEIEVTRYQVILGPMNWRPSFFNSCLRDDLNIIYSVPLVNVTQSKIVINETVSIIPVTNLGSLEEYDSKIQFPQGPYYNFYENYAEMYYVPENKNIDLVKSELKAKVAANRYKYEIKGVTTTIQNQEVYIWTNREDRSMYLQAYQLGANNVGWKFGNVFLTLTNAELGQIVVVCMGHVQDVFDWEGEVVATIDAATTLSELSTISVESDNPNWNPPINNIMPEMPE